MLDIATIFQFAHAGENIDFITFTIDCSAQRETWRRLILRIAKDNVIADAAATGATGATASSIVCIQHWNELRVHVIGDKIIDVFFAPLTTINIQFTMFLLRKNKENKNFSYKVGIFFTVWNTMQCVMRDFIESTSACAALGWWQSTSICVQVLVAMW